MKIVQMKRKQKLTAKAVNAFKSEVKRYRVWDTEIQGFHVRVSPVGLKAYALSYRHNGQPKEFTIGAHGNVTADLARTRAKSLAGQVATGTDIQEAKKEARREADAARYRTLKEFIDHKYGPWALSELKTGKEAIRSLRVDFERFHGKKLTDITPWAIESWTRDSRAQGHAPSTINRRMNTIKSALSKAVEWGVIDHSPLQ